MVDKIDQIKIGNNSYDIDLPSDATINVSSLTATSDITGNKIQVTGGRANEFLKADGTLDSNVYLTAGDIQNQTVKCVDTEFAVNGTVALWSGNSAISLTPNQTNNTITLTKADTWPSVTASNPTLAWSTSSSVVTVGDTTMKVTMPANPNTWPDVTAHNPALAFSTSSSVVTVGGTTMKVTMPANPNSWPGVTAHNPTLAWSTSSSVVTVGGTVMKVTMPAKPTLSVTASNPTLSWGTNSKVGQVGNTSFYVTMPANPTPDMFKQITKNGSWPTNISYDPYHCYTGVFGHTNIGNKTASYFSGRVLSPLGGISNQITNSSTYSFGTVYGIQFVMGIIPNNSTTTFNFSSMPFNAVPWGITGTECATGDSNSHRATLTSITSKTITFGNKTSGHSIPFLLIGKSCK